MTPRREQLRDDLFDLLVAMPDGVTITEIAATLGVSRRNADQAVHDLRTLLGDVDDINVPATPQGPGEQWRYQLIGNLDGCREWVANRIGDTASRIGTMRSMMASVVKASDGRTVEGRRARLIERALRRLIEDLDDVVV